MRLSKVKKVCMDAGQIRILTADNSCNMVVQWIGTDAALYPVEGLVLDLKTLLAIWEIDSKKAGEIDMAEGSYADMVDRGLLTEADARLLRMVAGSIDTNEAPLLGLGEVNGCKALACGEEQMIFLPPGTLTPCFKHGGINFDVIVQDGGARVAVYGGGSLIGLLWPLDSARAEGLHGIIRNMAEREVRGA